MWCIYLFSNARWWVRTRDTVPVSPDYMHLNVAYSFLLTWRYWSHELYCCYMKRGLFAHCIAADAKWRATLRSRSRTGETQADSPQQQPWQMERPRWGLDFKWIRAHTKLNVHGKLMERSSYNYFESYNTKDRFKHALTLRYLLGS